MLRGDEVFMEGPMAIRTVYLCPTKGCGMTMFVAETEAG
jgi:hypothetical protein